MVEGIVFKRHEISIDFAVIEQPLLFRQVVEKPFLIALNLLFELFDFLILFFGNGFGIR